MMVEMLTTGLVPSTGIKLECISRKMPDASPGIAASQKSSMTVNLKPMAGILTTTALMTNHVANENISENVVKAHVRHAIALPVSFQNCGSSGSHLGNLDIIKILKLNIGQVKCAGSGCLRLCTAVSGRTSVKYIHIRDIQTMPNISMKAEERTPVRSTSAPNMMGMKKPPSPPAMPTTPGVRPMWKVFGPVTVCTVKSVCG